MKLFLTVITWHCSFFFIAILVIVLFAFYCSHNYSCIVFVLFMALLIVLFTFYCSYILFVSLYKAYESIILGKP